MVRYCRRDFFRICGLGLGAGFAHSVGLGDLYKHAAMAAPIPQAAEASGAIFFVLNGGARTQAVFNGSVEAGANPFGQLTGLPVPLSILQRGTGLDDPDTNAKLNLIAACQHHNRTGSHTNGRAVACTGYTEEEDKPGILTLINHAFSFRDIPCVNIGSDSPVTNVGSEISTTFSPLKLLAFTDISELARSLATSATSAEETARIDRLRFSIEDRFLRSTKYPEPAQMPFYRRRSAELAARLDNPVLDITTTGALGTFVDGAPVGNRDLLPAFGVRPTGGGNRDGANAMLALRFRQLGVPAVAISTSQNWDLHQDEQFALPGRARLLGQAIAGLIQSMSRIADPKVPGKTLLDTTVITALTDFNRGNWSAATGFNSTRGSDHRNQEDKTAFQCIPIIGGGLPGGKVLGEIGADGSPIGSSPTFGTRQVLATVLDLMGLPIEGYFPGTTPLTAELTG